MYPEINMLMYILHEFNANIMLVMNARQALITVRVLVLQEAALAAAGFLQEGNTGTLK